MNFFLNEWSKNIVNFESITTHEMFIPKTPFKIRYEPAGAAEAMAKVTI